MKLIALQGAPGSGKSTLAQEIAETTAAVIVSADSYFHLPARGGQDRTKTKGPWGVYDFNPAELGFAHGRCLRVCADRLRDGDADIIVDNTNSSVAELAPYVALAMAYGFEVEIVYVQTDVETCLSRQTHGVPEHVVRSMVERLDSMELPPFWPARTTITES